MKRDWWKKEFRSLLTFGASITTGGWSSCRERCWANLLAEQINEVQRHPVQLTNMSIGANVISPRSRAYAFSSKPAASERLDKHVLEHTANGSPVVPDLLIICYGMNDARGGTPVGQFTEDYKRIIGRIRGKMSPLIMLLGLYHINDYALGGAEWSHANPQAFARYNEAIAGLAGACGCLYVDLLASYRQAPWLVHSDGVHANDLAHRVVANKVFEVLASNCSGLALETKELEKAILPWRDESTLQA